MVTARLAARNLFPTTIASALSGFSLDNLLCRKRAVENTFGLGRCETPEQFRHRHAPRTKIKYSTGRSHAGQSSPPRLRGLGHATRVSRPSVEITILKSERPVTAMDSAAATPVSHFQRVTLPGSNAKARAKSVRRKRGSCSRYGALTRLGRGISKAFQRQRGLKFNSLEKAREELWPFHW
jgi:hypothetical protein